MKMQQYKINNQTLKDANNKVIKYEINGDTTKQTTINIGNINGKINITTIYTSNEYIIESEKITGIKTGLMVDQLSTAKMGDTINFHGTLKDEDNELLSAENITITVKNTKESNNTRIYNVVTDKYGNFSINHTADSYGEFNVTFTYGGSETYRSSTNSTSYSVKRETNLYMYSRSGDTKGSTIKVSGKLQSNGDEVKGETVTIKVNGKTYTATTGGYGYFTVNHTISSYDDLNVTFTYAGSSGYLSCSNSTVYSVKKPTNLYMYTRSGDTKGSTIKVSGKLQYNDGEGAKGETVTIKVNDKTYTATTGGYGYFTVNHTITSYDNLNVTFTYAGSTKYLSSKNSTVYTVKKPTNLYMYSRSGDTKGSTIKVSGKLQSNGEGVKGETVTIKVNGKTYTATTGGYGYFTVNHTISSYDDLNVTFTYAGSSGYLSCSNSTVYSVKKPTNLYMYTRSGDTKGSTIKVSGKLQYNDGEGVKGETVTIKVNDKTYTATTGGYGYFTVNHTITSYDNLNVTFTYAGSTKYLSSKNSTVYTVKKPTTLFIYSRTGDAKGSTIKVSGKLLYGDEGVKGETVTIKVNGKTYTATTGGYGYFTVNYTITGYDDLNISMSYAGSTSYYSCSNSTVYTVKKPTNLYMYTRSNDKVGSTIKVSGKLQYNNGEGIKGETVTIKVNSKTYTATTGGYGYFTVNHTITSNDNLNVTFTYNGSKLYEKSTNSTVYTVKS